MNLVKVISTKIEAGKRLIKFLRYGLSDVQENNQILPHGIDSNPVADMIALYAPTGEDGENVIIGYINKNQIAEPGESRIFATDSDGTEVNGIYLKNDGTMEVGGNTDFMVRFNELKDGFDELVGDVELIRQVYNLHVHAGIGSPPTTTIVNPVDASIDGAKIDEIKTS